MKNFAIIIAFFIFAGITCQGQDKTLFSSIIDHSFSDFFSNKTMRVDYFHSGNANEEHFAKDRIVSDGPWSGPKTIRSTDVNRGLYQFVVFDEATNAPLYVEGFASIFGEWQTIPEARTQWGTNHESVRFPWPLKPVKLVMHKRDAKNEFVPIWETRIDPTSRQVNPADLEPQYQVWDYMVNGPAESKVDIVILGDGYTANEMDKFHADIERLCGALFAEEPFKTRKNDFNVRAVETPSPKTGVNKPHPGIFRRTPLSLTYSSFDSERYVLGFDNRMLRDVAAHVPYEYMYVLVNEKTYGGGGIYRLYATVATDNKFSDYIFVHELGHHFAALADEYYTSSVSYEMPEITVEPWEPNITAHLKPLKWAHLVEPNTPIPTPWGKDEFDQHGMAIQKERSRLRKEKVEESVMEALFERQSKEETRLFSQMKYHGTVGAFEGAGYYQHGMYRSSTDCIMYSRNKNAFCPVCQDAINHVIDLYTK